MKGPWKSEGFHNIFSSATRKPRHHPESPSPQVPASPGPPSLQKPPALGSNIHSSSPVCTSAVSEDAPLSHVVTVVTGIPDGARSLGGVTPGRAGIQPLLPGGPRASPGWANLGLGGGGDLVYFLSYYMPLYIHHVHQAKARVPSKA